MLFMLKALPVRKVFTFLPWLLDQAGKRLDKVTLISKFLSSQTWKQTITIPILPDISRSKSNGIMKFGQFINIFL